MTTRAEISMTSTVQLFPVL
ncbi:hypothetical protein LINPERPRIM_LOCUS13735 [Linum perenne]